MAIHFPTVCKLTDAERAVLSGILSDGEKPCEGCVWVRSCDGTDEEERCRRNMLANPEKSCFVCGNSCGPEYASRPLGGGFRFCDVHADEFAFRIFEKPAKRDPEQIEF